MTTSPLIKLTTAVSMIALLAACGSENQTQSKAPEDEVDKHAEIAATSAAEKSMPGKLLMHDQSSQVHMKSQFLPQPRHNWPAPNQDRENYAAIDDNPVKVVLKNPVSTFSIDVDTASYANVRRILNSGQMPPADAVRIEEMINYFSYAYAPPADQTRPFSVTYDVATTPWNEHTQLLRVGLKGLVLDEDERKTANLVFLLDVSGSMNAPDKLPLMISAMKMLSSNLGAEDKVSIVVYAGAAGVVLEPTAGNETGVIKAALEQLRAGGSTAGGAGISRAYDLAETAFVKGGINRVILATDGDFNVGISNVDELKRLIAKKRESGIALTTLGFGRGNINDELMETLADTGNGNYAYIDTAREARKVLVEQISGTLQTIAKDVKIQIEFNPAQIAEYRLIGYVNRQLKREDFRNDRIDAGEIGAGHTVTALYEITPVGSVGMKFTPLRYGQDKKVEIADQFPREFAHLRLRYKAPGGDTSELIEYPLSTAKMTSADLAAGDLAFAAAVAAFGQKLSGGQHLSEFNYQDIATLAKAGSRDNHNSYRLEFIDMVKLANSLEKSGG